MGEWRLPRCPASTNFRRHADMQNDSRPIEPAPVFPVGASRHSKLSIFSINVYVDTCVDFDSFADTQIETQIKGEGHGIRNHHL